MNKAELIDALAERLGDKKVAAAAVAGLVDVVVRTVNAGDKVTITGFGVFEKRARAARVARNPRTGETVSVSQTDVPTFRPGTMFREVVSGTRDLPRAGRRRVTAAARPSNPAPSAASTVASKSSAPASRPATKVTAAARPTAVNAASPQAATKAGKAATKAAKASKDGKAAKATKGPKAVKAAKAVKPAKGESKATTKTKGSAKKTGKKSSAKK